MQTPNIKIYLAVSGVLIVLFLVVTFIPFGKKSTNNQPPAINNLPTPTLVEVNQPPITSPPTGGQTPTIKPADFTGVKEEELPPEIKNISLQKQDLRSKLPLNLSTFSIGFDYSEDKFVVTLKDPKDQSRTEFESWRKANYPLLDINQFIFK